MNTQSQIIMPFGKYKENLICEIPSDYLEWICNNIEDDKIRNAADDEYNWRNLTGDHWYDR